MSENEHTGNNRDGTVRLQIGDRENPSRLTFTVDTNLFRELGELLVGRDSTALVELIKNAYDADATEVIVYGEALTDTGRGFIVVRDNGIGMSLREFDLGFLRIASRGKEQGNRRSPVFQRRFTGAKGVGRLAAHKLARVVEVLSLRWDGSIRKGHALRAERGVDAVIQWDLVEQQPTLDEVADTDAITVREVIPQDGAKAGTSITLRRLRRAWTRTAHSRFLEEVQTFTPPPVLIEPLPKSAVPSSLLFDQPSIRDTGSGKNGQFSVQLEGELAPPEDFWQAKADAANWVLEVDADSSGSVRYAISPTKATLDELPGAKSHVYTVPHPSGTEGPFFQGRVLLRTGRSWAGHANGVRVFVEGFRVLPYGEAGNDWLSLDRDATARGRTLFLGSDAEAPFRNLLPESKDEGLLILPNKHYFGGIFLTQEGSRNLKALVNREGFVPDSIYENLVTLVRGGIDLLTRARAAASEKERDQRRRKRASKSQEEVPSTGRLRLAIKEGQASVMELQSLIAAGNLRGAASKLDETAAKIHELSEASEELITETSMLRVLASVGTQMAAFVHEINGLVGTAESVDHALRRLRDTKAGGGSRSREQAEALRSLTHVVADLRRNLERQASYLVDVVAPDARRRRSRQLLASRFEAAERLVATSAEARGIRIENGIPAQLQSPPMFPAELTTIFSNLLTNAVKAAGDGGRIRATGKREKNGVRVRVENTGVRVRVADRERWFEPFESSTAKVDAVLGQGMGLGLPITRAVVAEYGGTINFVDPSGGFATAIELFFPT